MDMTTATEMPVLAAGTVDWRGFQNNSSFAVGRFDGDEGLASVAVIISTTHQIRSSRASVIAVLKRVMMHELTTVDHPKRPDT